MIGKNAQVGAGCHLKDVLVDHGAIVPEGSILAGGTFPQIEQMLTLPRIMAGAKIIVNFKTYASASGSQANVLAAAMSKQVSQSYRMVAVVSAFDLDSVTNENECFQRLNSKIRYFSSTLPMLSRTILSFIEWTFWSTPQINFKSSVNFMFR